MKRRMEPRREYGFAIGLAAGTLVGATLAIWLAPRAASEIRERLADSARGFGDRTSEQYQQATSRIGEAVDVLTRPHAL